jgi:hypothetical protein
MTANWQNTEELPPVMLIRMISIILLFSIIIRKTKKLTGFFQTKYIDIERFSFARKTFSVKKMIVLSG